MRGTHQDETGFPDAARSVDTPDLVLAFSQHSLTSQRLIRCLEAPISILQADLSPCETEIASPGLSLEDAIFKGY